MELTAINAFSIVIVFQLMLLVLFLLTSSKGKRTSNLLLASFFLLLTLNIVDGLLTYYGVYTSYPAFAHVEDGFIFLLGPVLYFYTRSMVFNDFSFRRVGFIHFVPFIVVTIGYQSFYHFQTVEYQRFIQNAITQQNLPDSFYFSVLLAYGHVIGYLLASFHVIDHYRLRIRDQFSSVHKINLDWLAFMLVSVGVVLLFSLLYTLLPLVGLREFFQDAFVLVFIAICVFTTTVMWKGLKQPEIFAGVPSEIKHEKKYASSSLGEVEKTQIRNLLEECMRNERPYLNADLSLDQLAQMIHVTSKKLSQCINEEYSRSFFDFINSYRIAEAQRIFRESTDPGITVLEVMYQSGFNSKSSFNTIFKQKTGVTPSAFRQRF